MTWTVKGYHTQEDFDNYNYEFLDEYIPTKKEAKEIADVFFEEGCEVVKIESFDQEEIDILRKK